MSLVVQRSDEDRVQEDQVVEVLEVVLETVEMELLNDQIVLECMNNVIQEAVPIQHV